MFNKEFEALKSKIAKSLKDTLYKESMTPPGERHVEHDVHVPYHQVMDIEDEPMAASAVVTYVVMFPKEKRNTVRVKFNYDKAGKLLRNTMVYV
jgi:hypothetical protein